MKKEKLIQEGLKAFLEEKLKILESSIEEKDEITKEVDEYFDAQRIAKKNGIDISKYRKRYASLIKKYWDNK